MQSCSTFDAIPSCGAAVEVLLDSVQRQSCQKSVAKYDTQRQAVVC